MTSFWLKSNLTSFLDYGRHSLCKENGVHYDVIRTWTDRENLQNYSRVVTKQRRYKRCSDLHVQNCSCRLFHLGLQEPFWNHGRWTVHGDECMQFPKMAEVEERKAVWKCKLFKLLPLLNATIDLTCRLYDAYKSTFKRSSSYHVGQ